MSDEIEQFSSIGAEYDAQLSRGLKATGEPPSYFARHRIECVRRIAAARGKKVETILDFGCGPGTSFVLLRAYYPRARIIGYEPAYGLRVLAARAAQASGAEMLDSDDLALTAEADIVYCNGVFHHIPPSAHATAIAAAARALRDDGLIFVWENSPFNPGTRLVMSRVSFDRDARLLWPAELRALQRSAALAHVATEYHFVFPHALRALRVVEPALRSIPLGGQYVVIGERRAPNRGAGA